MTPLRTISFVGLGLLLGLGGCTTAPEPAPKPVAAKPAPAKTVKPTKKPTRKPAKPDAEPASAAEMAAEPGGVASPPSVPPSVPAPAVVEAPPIDVVGKSEADVIALLGRPSQEQMASAAKVMRFAADGCAVEVHLFADVKQGGYRVLETTGAGTVPASQCLGKVRAGRG